MNWHIVTGSKGGSGKTLLSLMLTNYSRTLGEVLVIDLNGMNADISRLIADAGSVRISIDLDIIGRFHLEKPRGQSYIIGWPEDAFTLLNIKDFQQFFLQVRARVVEKIQNELSFGIKTIIIDTNYHFCNIFPNRVKEYQTEPFRSFGKDGTDNLFIWFLWTYRQLKNILEASDDSNHPHYNDMKTIMERAVLIEAMVKNRVLGENPFVHVFNPFSIGQFISLFHENGLLHWIKQDKTITNIKPLGDILALKQRQVGNSVEFGAFIATLKHVRTQLLQQDRQKFSTTHDLFLALLDNYANFLKDRGGCPRNLIPIHVYQKDMIGYTEADYSNLLDDMNALPVYTKSFVPAYGKLLHP